MNGWFVAPELLVKRFILALHLHLLPWQLVPLAHSFHPAHSPLCTSNNIFLNFQSQLCICLSSQPWKIQKKLWWGNEWPHPKHWCWQESRKGCASLVKWAFGIWGLVIFLNFTHSLKVYDMRQFSSNFVKKEHDEEYSIQVITSISTVTLNKMWREKNFPSVAFLQTLRLRSK